MNETRASVEHASLASPLLRLRDVVRSSGRSLALLFVLAALLSVLCARLPLVRNSLVYARASENVIAAGYDPRPVVASSALSYDKPILFAWFAAPLVRFLGTHDGLRLASWITTAAYLLSILAFARAHRELLPARGEAAVLWLAALGPCVFYQFWSAHPDGWFAALVTLAWTQCRRIVSRPELDPRASVVALGLVVLLAILLKNYGLLLLVSVPGYLLWHGRGLRADRARARRLLAYGLPVLALLAAFALLAALGHNPLSRLEGEGGGVGQYGTGELLTSARGTLVQLGLALGLQFTLTLVALFRRRAWAGLAPGAVCFALPYVVGLMPFPTTFYNMRYFIPLFPFVALVVVRGLEGFTARTRGGLLISHGVLAIALVATFNSAAVYRRVRPLLPTLEVNWIGVPLSLLDNLRMPLHIDQQEILEHVDHEVPADAVLYWLDIDYYGDAQHGVYERAGLVRRDIDSRYVRSRDFRPEERVYYLYAPRASALDPLGTVTDLGGHLYRVESGHRD